jgi:hypothetical protein
MRRATGIVLAALAMVAGLAVALPAGAAAAEARPVEKVTVQIAATKGGHTHFLDLIVYPLRGLATVNTVIEDAHDPELGRGVAYAVAIPARPFEGSLDVTVPGLGEFVGTVSTEGGGSEAAKKCRSGGRPEEFGTFTGQIDFHGAGGYESWSATRAEVGVTRHCTPHVAEPVTPEDVFGAAEELGPVLDGPAPFRFFAHSRDRALEFIAWGTPYRDEGIVQFAALDREWLPGEVAVQRWVNRTGASLSATVAIGPGGDHPASVTFRPPHPFFGTGHYIRGTHTLTGYLGANFLGLRLHLTRHPLNTVLEDEEHGSR